MDFSSLSVCEASQKSACDFTNILENLSLLRSLNDLAAKLETFSERNNSLEVSSLRRTTETIRNELQNALNMATSAESPLQNNILSSQFLSSSHDACICCLTNRESHLETFSRLLSGPGGQKEVALMGRIHRCLDDAFCELQSLLTDLRLELVRSHYLTRSRPCSQTALQGLGHEKKAVHDPNSGLQLLEQCTACLDEVRKETSSSLLNQTFLHLFQQTNNSSTLSPCRKTQTVVCPWEKEPEEETEPRPVADKTEIQKPEEMFKKTESELHNSAQTEAKSALDILPFDVWRKVLTYLSSSSDDASVFALLQASRQFGDLLPQAIQDSVFNTKYWLNGLLRRGVDVERACGKRRSWLRCYHEYVQSMACFRCFGRLQKKHCQKRPENMFFTHGGENSHSYSQRIVREAQRVAAGAAVLDVRFCNWEADKPHNEQQHFDSLIISLLGPPSTPYYGGRFQLWIHFPSNYPFAPPRAQLLTKILSPYFTDHGDFYFSYNKVCGGKEDVGQDEAGDQWRIEGGATALNPFRGSGTSRTPIQRNIPRGDRSSPSCQSATAGDYVNQWNVTYEIGRIVEVAMRCLALAEDMDTEDGVSSTRFAVVNDRVHELRQDNREMFDILARKMTQTYAMQRWMNSSRRKSVRLNFDTEEKKCHCEECTCDVDGELEENCSSDCGVVL